LPNFTNFALDEKILKLLNEIGYEKPTPIQSLAIPKVLEGSDVIASAQTGTGKTAAFMLPILHLLSQPDYRAAGGPQVLILVPTRELAMQVADEAKKFSKYLSRTKTVCIYGGVPYPPQNRALAGRYEILVATPGRLKDQLDAGRVDLSRVKIFVLDEADRMLDMGFVDDVEEIARAIPAGRQTLLFSATIDHKILPFSNKIQNKPHHLKVEHDPLTQSHIEQRLYYVDDLEHKKSILEHIIKTNDVNQSIIFTSTIKLAGELASYLYHRGYASEALHGDMHQRQRTKTIERLRRGDFQFLIATDVAARGIDIASLSHIINFDLPFQAEDFIHRIGRTGRAGATGVAMTFASFRDRDRVVKIERLLGKPLEIHIIEGLEPRAREQEKFKPQKNRRSLYGNKSNAARTFSKAPAAAAARGSKPSWDRKKRA
jgi:superfamily II DNA/RNA helicase